MKAGLLAALLLIGCGGRDTSPLSVILITLDTTRADHLGAYGYTRSISPSLDAFARDAVVFQRAWSTSSWTLPAHASILTGKNPTSHGAHNNLAAGSASLGDVVPRAWFRHIKVNRLAESEVTLAELLREKGYATAAFAGGPWLSPGFGLLQGYQFQDAEVKSAVGRPANALTDAAISWLESVPSEQAFHLLLNYFDPHYPYEPPPGFDDPPLASRQIPVNPSLINHGRPLQPGERETIVERYDAEIRFMDHQFGRLIQALKDLERYDNALIVVVADHGELLGEHSFIGHGRWLYEELLRVPLFVRFPRGRRSGSKVNAPLSLVDLLPLIAEELELLLPPGVEGVSVGERRVVLAEVFRNGYAVKYYGVPFDRDLVALIRWPWKLIVSDRGKSELFQLETDSLEAHDRSGKQEERELRAELELARAALSPPSVPAPATVDPALREQLRGLGYIE